MSADEAAESVTAFLDLRERYEQTPGIRLETPNGIVATLWDDGRHDLTVGSLRALLAGYKELRKQMTANEVICPVCEHPRRLTSTGLIHYHGPHNRPCRASGTRPESWAPKEEQ